MASLRILSMNPRLKSMQTTEHIASMRLVHRWCWIFVFICHQQAFSQLPASEVRNGASIHLPGTIFLNDLLKDTYTQKKYADVKGSPYYKEEWKSSSIVFKDGKQYNDVKVKVNLFSHEFVCLTAANTEITLKDGIVNRLVLYDTNESRHATMHVFAAGIPFAEKDTTYPILEVLTEGKAILFNLIKKKITNTNDALGMGEQKEFTSSESLYIFYNNELKKCGKNADYYANLFTDKKDMVAEFIKMGKLKCRNSADAILVVNYYNSL